MHRSLEEYNVFSFFFQAYAFIYLIKIKVNIWTILRVGHFSEFVAASIKGLGYRYPLSTRLRSSLTTSITITITTYSSLDTQDTTLQPHIKSFNLFKHIQLFTMTSKIAETGSIDEPKAQPCKLPREDAIDDDMCCCGETQLIACKHAFPDFASGDEGNDYCDCPAPKDNENADLNHEQFQEDDGHMGGDEYDSEDDDPLWVVAFSKTNVPFFVFRVFLQLIIISMVVAVYNFCQKYGSPDEQTNPRVEVPDKDTNIDVEGFSKKIYEMFNSVITRVVRG